MKFGRNIVIEADAEKAWEIIGEQFGEISKWTTSLQTSRLEGQLGIGAIRITKGPGFGPIPAGEVKEKILTFDPSEHSFSYSAFEGLPGMLQSSQASWKIKALDKNSCEVSWNVTIQFAWWAKPLQFIFPKLMERTLQTFEEEMKYRIEKKQPHPRKLNMIQKKSVS